MENVELIKNAFRPLKLSLNTHSWFFEQWEEVDFSRGSIITDQGSFERYFYVVVSGVQAISVISKSGDKVVIGFSFDGSFTGVYDAFLNNSRSLYFLESVTSSRLLRLSKANYDKLFDKYPEFNYWGRITHQNLLIGRVKREVELITMTSKERYDIFMDRCPAPLLTIPQKYLASYLNMRPETFSRLRRLKS